MKNINSKYADTLRESDGRGWHQVFVNGKLDSSHPKESEAQRRVRHIVQSHHKKSKTNAELKREKPPHIIVKKRSFVKENASVKVDIFDKAIDSFLIEAAVKQFPKNRKEHAERMHNTHLYNTYHKALAHAKTLSDNDVAARVKRHEDERHREWHEGNPARKNPDGNIPNIETAHFKLQAYQYEHRNRKGQKHPDLDSGTPEYIDQITKDRY
jgi:hypothetical protein